MSWILNSLYGIRRIFNDGALLPERGGINFVGAVAVDDPANSRTNVTFPAATLLDSATSAATPNTLAKRGGAGACSFAGTCNFVDVTASGALSCDSLSSATTCDADTFTAGSSVTSPLFESSAAGVWRTEAKSAPSAASGLATFASGDSTGPTGSSGFVVVKSGDTPDGAGISGFVGILTGASGGISGSISIVTGTSDGTSATGNVLIGTGAPVGTGDSGHIFLEPGTGNNKGNISLGEQSNDFGGGYGIIRIAPAYSAPSSPLVSGGLLYTKTADKELYFFTPDGVERGLAFRKDITQTTSNTTVTCASDTDFLQLTSTSPVNVTLPPGVIGKTIHISKDGAGSVTISGDSGEEFYTNSLNLTYTLNANSTVTMRFGNGYWRAFE